jgi:dihydroorotate dehydrogenase electron transfer subunit
VEERASVLERSRIGAYHLLTLVAPKIARTVQPGQFVEVAVGCDGAFLLRRPFSVHQTDRGRPGTIELAFEVLGAGTRALAAARRHDRLDVIGPLGRAFTVPAERTPCVLVGGGYGAAPLFFLAEQLRARRCRVDVVIGAATAGRLFRAMEAKRVSTSLTVTTDDGSAGSRGVVTDVLPRLMTRSKTRALFACGPMPMLAAVSRVAAEAGVACEVAVEERMACGTGVCFTCVVPLRAAPGKGAEPEGAAHGTRMVRSCTDGPVFDGQAIAWRQPGQPGVPRSEPGRERPPPRLPDRGAGSGGEAP